jgi:hypothetical protein
MSRRERLFFEKALVDVMELDCRQGSVDIQYEYM